jgi:hypothetical protein
MLSTGLISGVSLGAALAFIGVIITQIMQGRRDQKSREHQLLLYANQWADQREQDNIRWQREYDHHREQWQEERRIDELTRAREDRHRFAQSRRELYGELISAVDLYVEHIAKMEFDRSKGRNLTTDQNVKREDLGIRLRTIVNQVTVVAPRSISDHAKNLFDEVAHIFIKMAEVGPGITIVPDPHQQLAAAHRKMRRIVEEMRVDFGADAAGNVADLPPSSTPRPE